MNLAVAADKVSGMPLGGRLQLWPTVATSGSRTALPEVSARSRPFRRTWHEPRWISGRAPPRPASRHLLKCIASPERDIRSARAVDELVSIHRRCCNRDIASLFPRGSLSLPFSHDATPAPAGTSPATVPTFRPKRGQRSAFPCSPMYSLPLAPFGRGELHNPVLQGERGPGLWGVDATTASKVDGATLGGPLRRNLPSRHGPCDASSTSGSRAADAG